MAALPLLLLLAACGFAKDVSGEISGEIGGTAAEWIACPTDLIDCGHVYLCAQPADNPLGHVEVCLDDDDDPDAVAKAEAVFGPCEPTPRHQGLCRFCPPERGCNAYSGCFGCEP